MGQSVSQPSNRCLPMPEDESFLNDLIGKGVVYLSKCSDGFMHNVSTPKGWGILYGESQDTYWGGRRYSSFLIDDEGNYVAVIEIRNSGDDRKESAHAEMNRFKSSKKIDIKWCVNESGKIILDKDDMLRKEKERLEKEESMKKEFEERVENTKKREQLRQYELSLKNYKEHARKYKTFLNDCNDPSKKLKLNDIYIENLDLLYQQLSCDAENLGLEMPAKENLDF